MKFTFKECTPIHINEIMKMQEDVLLEIKETPHILFENSKEFILKCMESPCIVLGAFYEKELIAFAMLNVPHSTKSTNMCEEMGVDTNELCYVGNTKLVIVKKEYRGNNLQQILFTRLEEFARKNGMKHLYTTVSPDNKHSKQNIEALGYQLHHMTDNYNGLVRCVFYKKI